MRPAREPRVELDAAEIDEVEERPAILTEHIVDRPPGRPGNDPLGLDPARKKARHVLMKKTLVANSVWLPVQRLRPVDQIRKYRVCDTFVVTNEIAFGVTLLGPEHLRQMSERRLIGIQTERALPVPDAKTQPVASEARNDTGSPPASRRRYSEGDQFSRDVPSKAQPPVAVKRGSSESLFFLRSAEPAVNLYHQIYKMSAM